MGDLLTLGVMGIRGSFSEEAALEYARDNNLGEVEIVELLNTEKVLRSVEAGDGESTGAKAAAVGRALDLLPSASVAWFEDAIHDIPLQRPAELATELARFAKEVSGRG